MINMSNVICFDLEGPLSPQDNAFEVMGLIENGHRIFETISKYDDLIALEGKEDYEAGDTLSLIAPFLVYHDISEEDIVNVSSKAALVNGAKTLMRNLGIQGWDTYVISTSYEQHAYNIGRQVGVRMENIACTSFPLDDYRKEFSDADTSLLEDAEKEILEMYPPINDIKLKMKMDRFFFRDLANSPFGIVMEDMEVVGGARKVEAARVIAERHGKSFREIVVVGDSITDMKMLKAVNDAGGLSIAFNGNKYAIPHATISVATTDLMDLLDLLTIWKQGGRSAVLESIEKRKNRKEPFIHAIAGRKDLNEIIEIHRKIRSRVRGKAAKLG